MRQTLIPFIPIIFVLATVMLVLVLYRKSRQGAARFATGLGSDELKSGHEYQAQAHGTKYYYVYFAGSKNTPPYFKIWIDCPSRGAFRIGRETALDRFFKQLGITVEIQTGDTQFDRDYFISTDAVAFTRACFSSADCRQRIRELSALGFNKIFHNGRILEAKITPLKFERGPDKTGVEAAVACLAALGRDLPEEFYEQKLVGMTAWKAQRRIIYTLSISAVVLGFIGLLWGKTSFPPFDEFLIFKDSLRYSIPALLVFAAISVYVLKGRSSSHIDVLANLGFGIIGFPLAFYSGMVTGNGYLDNSPASYHEARVAGKHSTRSKNSTYYYVSLVSWRAGHDREQIKINRHSYNEIQAGNATMGITTRPGRLGYEWLVSYKVVRDE